MSVDARGATIPEEVAKRYRATVPKFAGQSSVLYEGIDPSSGLPVLVKVLRDAAIASPAEKQRITRELQKLTQVQHPGLPQVFAAGEEKGCLWLARERVDGESLSEKISRNGPLQVADAARVAAQLAAALGELHRHGVLHRDVRPGHV